MLLYVISQGFGYQRTSTCIKMTCCIIRIITVISHIFILKNFKKRINIKACLEKNGLFLFINKSSCEQRNTFLFAQMCKCLEMHLPIFFAEHIVIMGKYFLSN